MLLGSFAGHQDLNLHPSGVHMPCIAAGVWEFCSFPFPFMFRSTAPLSCKTPLLLLGIVGLVAAFLEIEDGLIAPLI